jgi:hypothetical protein
MVHSVARKPPSFQAIRALSGFDGARDCGEPQPDVLAGDRGDAGDQVRMIAHHARMMHRGIFATLICDCCRSLISNNAELTGVKEL